MDEMSPRLAEALARVEPAWDDARSERAWVGFGKRRRRRAIARVSGAAAGVAAAAVLVFYLAGKGGDEQTVAERTAPAEPEAPVLAPENPDDIVIHDGFSVTPEKDARVDVVRGDLGVKLSVLRGKSRFRVRPSAKTDKVDVRAGDLQVTVFASEFSVARYADVAEVWSHRGRMELLWQGDTIILEEGEHRRFDAGAGADEATAPPAADQTADDRPRRPHSTDWRPLAREGRYEQAYALLRKAPTPSQVADLMLAADVYRLSGHPRGAVAPLRRVVGKHRSDPRAPLAAFTLGRVLLDDLGRPADAASAFAKSRSFAPDGPLAEDALAREVEAWAKAGQASRARARAELYLQSYPRGHRARAVRQYGGL